MKKEYIIVGSNNFWYASCISNKKDALEEAREIMRGEGSYGNDESIGSESPQIPETLYIYKAEEVGRLENKVE